MFENIEGRINFGKVGSHCRILALRAKHGEHSCGSRLRAWLTDAIGRRTTPEQFVERIRLILVLSSPFVVEVKRRRVKQSPPCTSPLESAARRMAARAPSIGSTCSPLRRKKVIWRLPTDLAHSKEGFGCRQARTVVHRRTNRIPLHTMAKRSTDEDKLTSVRCVRKFNPVYLKR